MNKKITYLAVVLIVAVMLIPTIGIVAAGKGQEKLSFELQIAGVPDPETENYKSWEPGINTQGRGRNFFITHPELTFILIDENSKIKSQLFNKVAFSLFWYDILAPFSREGKGFTRNAIRWQQMSEPAEKDLYAVDLRSVALRLYVDF